MIIIAATTVIISFDLLLVVDDRELTTKYHISVHVLLWSCVTGRVQSAVRCQTLSPLVSTG